MSKFILLHKINGNGTIIVNKKEIAYIEENSEYTEHSYIQMQSSEGGGFSVQESVMQIYELLQMRNL